jgi:Receptor family ligand binding region
VTLIDNEERGIEVDYDSVKMALSNIPVNDTTRNSRIIVLVAYKTEAFSILKFANEMGFQNDTVWVGPSSWSGLSPDKEFNFFPEFPGYIGVTPYRNRDDKHNNFLSRSQNWAHQTNRETYDEFPNYRFEYLVDAIILDDKVESARLRREQLFREREQLQEKPDTWSDSRNILIEVLPHEDQYWIVNEQLQDSMKDAYISKLWRVQNVSLWTYYSFHKDRLSMNGVLHNEKSVWHGTSNVDPAVIYNDKQDGFMMQYSRSGYWG